MALEIDPKRTAVLALDLQNELVNATPGGSQVLVQVRRVLEVARRRAIPIIHITVSFRADYRDLPVASPLFATVRDNTMLCAGTPGAEIHPDVSPREREPVLNKTTVDPFLTTNLQSLLHNFDVNTLVLMGLWTNYVVEATARHAADMSYRVLVVREACASNSEENHDFAMERILPTLATVTSVDEVLQALG